MLKLYVLIPFPPLTFSQAPVDENQNKDRTERKGKSGPSSPPTSGRKPGILYLSSIPPGFNVSQTTMFFAQFGQVGRVFLQPDPVEKAKSRNGMARHFTEGWVEFASKRVAKEVAEGLNRTQVKIEIILTIQSTMRKRERETPFHFRLGGRRGASPTTPSGTSSTSRASSGPI